jgi:uncharacterized protein (UPF0261 family)
MADCVSQVVRSLHSKGEIDGVLGMGGLQNTIVCSAALRQLPLGFPKFICSTIASGNRYFDTIVGDKDIAVMPSIVDFAGINPISEVILTNSVASIEGMVKYGKKKIDTHGKNYIGATLMGITNDTVMRAINNLTAHGENVISFHSTGIGGRVLESQIRHGNIAAVMDLCLHEMTAEYLEVLDTARGPIIGWQQLQRWEFLVSFVLEELILRVSAKKIFSMMKINEVLFGIPRII